MAYLRLIHSAGASPTPDSGCLDAYDRELDYIFATLRRLGAAPHAARRSRAGDFRGAAQELAEPGYGAASPPLPRGGGVQDRQRPPSTPVPRNPPPGVGRHRSRGQSGRAATKQRVGLSSSGCARFPAPLAPDCACHARARRDSHCRCCTEDVHHSIRRLRQTAKGPKGTGGGCATLVERRSTTMTRDPDLDSDLEALVEAGKVVPRLPDVVRARSLARARAIVVAEPSRAEPILVPRRRGLTIALAASVAVAVAGASALAALALRSDHGIATAPPAARAAAPARSATGGPAQATPPAAVTLPARTTPTTRPRPSVRPASARESYAAELNLLKRAQVAYAEGDYADTLALVAEHDRRFPTGRLAEEREALRVRTLTKAGRTDEAQRAAAAFADRFPRSVLLPRAGRDLR